LPRKHRPRAEHTRGASDGTGPDAQFINPTGIAVDSADNVYVAEWVSNTIRKIAPDGTVTTLAGLAEAAGNADGTPEPTYQWQRNGTAIAGATTSTLSLASATTADAGDYTVVLTNDLGTGTSDKATLTVTSAPTPPASGGGSSSGGGAPALWFGLVITTLFAWRQRNR